MDQQPIIIRATAGVQPRNVPEAYNSSASYIYPHYVDKVKVVFSFDKISKPIRLMLVFFTDDNLLLVAEEQTSVFLDNFQRGGSGAESCEPSDTDNHRGVD